jgi:hypothetical protein
MQLTETDKLITCEVTVHWMSLQRPAKHLASSALWELLEGHGYVVYEMPRELVEELGETPGFILYPIAPGYRFSAFADSHFFFMPQVPRLKFEVTCMESSFAGEDLQFMEAPPREAYIYTRGMVLDTYTQSIDLEYGDGVADIPIVDPMLWDEIGIGNEVCLKQQVNIKRFCQHMRRTGSSTKVFEAIGQPALEIEPSPSVYRKSGNAEIDLDELHPRASRFAMTHGF